MRQAIMRKPGVIDIVEVNQPTELGAYDVMLQIKKIGVCGSDIHVYHGKHPFTSYPVVQGHEYSGQVVKVGSMVTKVVIGDKATARPQQVCRKCSPCKRGDYNICDELKVEGFQASGSAQDYFVLPEERIVKLPQDLSYEKGAMVEPAAVGAHSSNRAGNLVGKNVVVIGAGPIGNLVAQFAQVRGAAKVLITDISDFRLNKSLECGIKHTVNVEKKPFEEAVDETFGKAGFDVAFECAGLEVTLDQAVQNINKGGVIVVVAVYGNRPKVDMAIVGDRELTLVGTLMYLHEDYIEAVNLISQELIKTDPLFTKHFDFEDYLEAYQFIDVQGDKTLKVIIDM